MLQGPVLYCNWERKFFVLNNVHHVLGATGISLGQHTLWPQSTSNLLDNLHAYFNIHRALLQIFTRFINYSRQHSIDFQMFVWNSALQQCPKWSLGLPACYQWFTRIYSLFQCIYCQDSYCFWAKLIAWLCKEKFPPAKLIRFSLTSVWRAMTCLLQFLCDSLSLTISYTLLAPHNLFLYMFSQDDDWLWLKSLSVPRSWIWTFEQQTLDTQHINHILC